MKNKSQAGFAATEALLVVIAITLIAFVGYYVYHSQHTANKTLSQATNTSQNNKPAVVISPQYLTIKEAGIKLKLVNATRGLSYSANTAFDGTVDVFLSTPSFKKAVAACRTNPSSGDKFAIGVISKHPGTYDASATQNVFGSFAKQMPGSWLEYSNQDGGYCDNGDRAAAAKVQSIFDTLNPLLKEATKNAQATQ
jgi:hypothetical protein